MKKFWHILKKILTVVSGLACAVLFVVVLTSAVQKQQQLTCKKISVSIDYDSGLAFLSEEEIAAKINFLSGGTISGQTISTIDFGNLERQLEKNPFIDNAEIFVDQQQAVNVRVVQKRPILRILNSDGVGYYISEKNERIPLSDKFTPHVTIATGRVEMHESAKRDSTLQAALYNLIQFIRKDEFLNALVDQINVSENGEMELVPKISGHVIRIGNPEEKCEEKFGRLKIFYKEGMSREGWGKYKAIDLRFENQVVCEKRDSVSNIIQP